LRIKEAGANAVKILVYYNPFEKDWVNDRKRAWVERIGAECKAVDIPFFLEFLPYDVHGEGEKSIEYARRKPEIILKSMEEFSRERYGADVLKIEVPMQMAHVEGTRAYRGQKLHTRAEAMEFIRAEAALTGKRSFSFPLESAARSFLRLWSWRLRAARSFTVCWPAAPPGRMVFPSSSKAAPLRSKRG